MYDFHVHTYFSDDCSIEMESYVVHAMKKGLTGICFTDHVDLDYPSLETKFLLDYNAYIHEIGCLKEKYKGKLEILAGIEFGMQPHIIETDQSFFHEKSFDYILGSIHVASKKELYGGDFLVEKTEKQGITDYFNDLISCVKSFNSFHNLGHLDVISRYVSKGSYHAIDYMEHIEEALRALVNAGKGLEINTSGKRYGLLHFHPEPSILTMYKKLGGEIVTLGSDSHNPSTLGYGFTEAKEMLQSIGFKYHTIFKCGKPEFIKLS